MYFAPFGTLVYFAPSGSRIDFAPFGTRTFRSVWNPSLSLCLGPVCFAPFGTHIYIYIYILLHLGRIYFAPRLGQYTSPRLVPTFSVPFGAHIFRSFWNPYRSVWDPSFSLRLGPMYLAPSGTHIFRSIWNTNISLRLGHFFCSVWDLSISLCFGTHIFPSVWVPYISLRFGTVYFAPFGTPIFRSINS